MFCLFTTNFVCHKSYSIYMGVFLNANNELFCFFFRHVFHNFAVSSFFFKCFAYDHFSHTTTTSNQNMSNHIILLQMKKNQDCQNRRQIFIAHAYVCIHYLVCIAYFVLSMEFHYIFFCFFSFFNVYFDTQLVLLFC